MLWIPWMLENFVRFPASVKSLVPRLWLRPCCCAGDTEVFRIPPQTRKEPLVPRIHYGLGLHFFSLYVFLDFVFAILFNPSFNDLASCFFMFN